MIKTKEEIAELKLIVDGAPDEKSKLTHVDSLGFYHTNDGNNLDDLRTIIAQYEEIERLRNPWISVEDELPEINDKDSEWLLVRNPKNPIPFVARLIYWPDMNEPEWQTNGGGIAVVSEWATLPEDKKND